jgi:hypothetical protein
MLFQENLVIHPSNLPRTQTIVVEVPHQEPHEPTTYSDCDDEYDEYDDDDDDDDDDGMIDKEDEVTEELEPLFLDGCRICSNLLDMADEEPLFVMELTSEERSRARLFPNGNGECDEACRGNIISV